MHRKRRFLVVVTIALTFMVIGFLQDPIHYFSIQSENKPILTSVEDSQQLAITELESLVVKGRAPKTGYTRLNLERAGSKMVVVIAR